MFSTALSVPVLSGHQKWLGRISEAHQYLFRKSLVDFPIDRKVMSRLELSMAMPLGSVFQAFLSKSLSIGQDFISLWHIA